MKTLLDIVDNGRRLVSIEYTNEDIAEINAGLRRRQEALQREYDILNQNTLQPMTEEEPVEEEPIEEEPEEPTEEEPTEEEPEEEPIDESEEPENQDPEAES